MRAMSNYLIIILTVMLFLFRLIVVFTTTMGIEFVVKSINPDYEIALLFIMIISIILLSRNKLSGAIILLIGSVAYYGPGLFEQITYIALNTANMELVTQILISLVGILIPIFAFFIIVLAKWQEKRPIDKKTDFFYKNEAYDRKYDDRADRNNYRTL